MSYTRRLFNILLVLVLLLSSSLVQAQAPQQTTQYKVYLPFTSGGNGGGSAHAPSSVDLIDQAVAAGTLDDQTGLLYKLYAAFGDPRLPAAFHSANPGPSSTVLMEASERVASLRPEIRAAIESFLLPPNAPGSWNAQREGVQGVSPTTAPWLSLGDELEPRRPYRIWYRAEGEVATLRALRILTAMDNTIWPKITELMGAPRPDADFINNGAGPEFDIYLVKNRTKAVPYPGKGCSQNSAYVLVNSDYLDIEDLAAHVMLATLYSYKVGGCKQYEWLFAATAAWAVDLAYLQAQDEHDLAWDVLRRPEVALEENHADLASQALLSDITININHSPAYLLPFYLARKLGNPGHVRAIWDRAGNGNSLAAVDGAVPGNLKELWPAFALANWNRKPHDDYEQIDGLTERAKPVMDAKLQLDATGQLAVPLTSNDVPHLAARYYHFQIPSDAAGVTFYNGWTYDLQKSPEGVYIAQPLAEGFKKGARIQALLKINGAWQPVRDWTNQSLQFMCRDRQAERVEEIVMIVSNSEWQDRAHVLKPVGQPPLLALSNIGCHKWQGTTTVQHNSSSAFDPGYSRITVSANITWDSVAAPQGSPDSTAILYPYTFKPSGSVSFQEVFERWVGNPPEFECGGTIRGSKAISTHDAGLRFAPVLAPESPHARSYDGSGLIRGIPVQVPCEGDDRFDATFFRLPPNTQLKVHPNGRVITGSFTEDCRNEEEDECSTTYTWDFESRPEQ